MVLVCAVVGRPGREFARTALGPGSGCPRAADGISRCAVASPAAMTPTAAASAASAPLPTALTTLGAISRDLPLLLAACLDVGTRLRACCGRRSAGGGLSGTRIDVPVAWRPSVVIAVMIASISVAAIVAASLSLCAPTIAVTPPLTAVRATRLPGVIPSAVAIAVAAA
jgi:hypothetical protein